MLSTERAHHAPRGRILALALLALLPPAAACGERAAAPRDSLRSETAQRSAPESPTTAPPLTPPRHPLPAPVIRWLRGGSERDTLLAYPRQAVADARNLYILDSGRGEIVALRAVDGALAWRTGRTRAPATPPLAPAAIAPLPGGGLAVVDVRHHTISLLDPEGHLRASRDLPPTVGSVRALCALSHTHFLAATGDTSHALLELRDDAPPRHLPLPWRDLAARHYLTTQAWLAGSAARPRCLVALVLGRGFSLYDGERYTPPASYVEPFELPAVTRTRRTDGDRTVVRERLSNDRTAARDAAIGGGWIAIAFGGETGLRARLVDFYDEHSGAYLGTTPLGRRVSAIAAHGSHLYVLYQHVGRPAVAALADTSAPPVALTRR